MDQRARTLANQRRRGSVAGAPRDDAASNTDDLLSENYQPSAQKAAGRRDYFDEASPEFGEGGDYYDEFEGLEASGQHSVDYSDGVGDKYFPVVVEDEGDDEDDMLAPFQARDQVRWRRQGGGKAGRDGIVVVSSPGKAQRRTKAKAGDDFNFRKPEPVSTAAVKRRFGWVDRPFQGIDPQPPADEPFAQERRPATAAEEALAIAKRFRDGEGRVRLSQIPFDEENRLFERTPDIKVLYVKCFHVYDEAWLMLSDIELDIGDVKARAFRMSLNVLFTSIISDLEAMADAFSANMELRYHVKSNQDNLHSMAIHLLNKKRAFTLAFHKLTQAKKRRKLARERKEALTKILEWNTSFSRRSIRKPASETETRTLAKFINEDLIYQQKYNQ